jgi:hypothetical protein
VPLAGKVIPSVQQPMCLLKREEINFRVENVTARN